MAMSQLKLVALDQQDLDIVSAHVQDAVMKVGDLSYLKGEGRFLVAMNRFVWENKPGFFTRRHERRRCVLHFEGVSAVRFNGFQLQKSDDVLSLLALRFTPGDMPAGTIELTCAAGAAIQLDVAYVEARLADLGAAWETPSRPVHRT